MTEAASPPPSTDAPHSSVKRQFGWALGGNAFYAGCQWASLIAIARLGSPEDLGTFALGLAISAPIFIFAQLKLRQVQATDTRREYEFGDYLGLRLTTTALACTTVAGVALLSGSSPQTTCTILVIALAKGCESLSDLAYGLLQRYERLDLVARSMMSKGMLSVALLGLGLWLGESIVWGAAGLAAAFAITLLLDASMLLTVARHEVSKAGEAPISLRPRWRMPVQRRLIALTLPLGFVTMLGALQTNIPRYVVQHELGEAELGIYSALAYLLTAGSTTVTALSQAAVTRLATYHTQGNRRSFTRLLARTVGIGCLVGGAGLAVSLTMGEPLLRLVYGAPYAARADVLDWLMLTAWVRYAYTFLGTAANAMRKYRFQPAVHGLGSLAVALGAYFWVPLHGILGAAWALLAAALVEALCYGGVTIWLLKRFHVDPAARSSP